MPSTKTMILIEACSILTSGEFSDVTVICGDKEWQLHRLILSCRSFHFRDILTQLVDIEVRSPLQQVLCVFENLS